MICRACSRIKEGKHQSTNTQQARKSSEGRSHNQDGEENATFPAEDNENREPVDSLPSGSGPLGCVKASVQSLLVSLMRGCIWLLVAPSSSYPLPLPLERCRPQISPHVMDNNEMAAAAAALQGEAADLTSYGKRMDTNATMCDSKGSCIFVNHETSIKSEGGLGAGVWKRQHQCQRCDFKCPEV